MKWFGCFRNYLGVEEYINGQFVASYRSLDLFLYPVFLQGRLAVFSKMMLRFLQGNCKQTRFQVLVLGIHFCNSELRAENYDF